MADTWSRACFPPRLRRLSEKSAAIRCSCWSSCCSCFRQSRRGQTSRGVWCRRSSTGSRARFWGFSASRLEMLHGWVILDKPVGLGSTTAVSAVKRILREAGEPKTKVGHGGTLDPLASGVLPIALGEATKLCGRMLDATKAYDFTIKFGEETDTLDTEGQIVATSDVRPTPKQIEAVLPRFTGVIDQVPPTYSALKIEGKPAYARARAGEQVELQSRK